MSFDVQQEGYLGALSPRWLPGGDHMVINLIQSCHFGHQ